MVVVVFYPSVCPDFARETASFASGIKCVENSALCLQAGKHLSVDDLQLLLQRAQAAQGPVLREGWVKSSIARRLILGGAGGGAAGVGGAGAAAGAGGVGGGGAGAAAGLVGGAGGGGGAGKDLNSQSAETLVCAGWYFVCCFECCSQIHAQWWGPGHNPWGPNVRSSLGRCYSQVWHGSSGCGQIHRDCSVILEARWPGRKRLGLDVVCSRLVPFEITQPWFFLLCFPVASSQLVSGVFQRGRNWNPETFCLETWKHFVWKPARLFAPVSRCFTPCQWSLATE